MLCAFNRFCDNYSSPHTPALGGWIATSISLRWCSTAAAQRGFCIGEHIGAMTAGFENVQAVRLNRCPLI